MEDLIKRDDAKQAVCELLLYLGEEDIPTVAENVVRDIPPADRPIGENLNSDYAECDQFVCSECGIHLQDWVMVDDDLNAYQYVFKFCPNCGARMKGADDEYP